MAYNNGYQPYYQQDQYYGQSVYNPQYMQNALRQNYTQQNYQQNYQQQNYSQQNTQQNQLANFILVPNEDFARNYPVAPGNSITFKDENASYIYTKTMGISTLDSPIFEKYKLVREEDVQKTPTEYVPDDNFKKLEEEIEKLRGEVNVLKEQISKPNSRRKDAGGD